MRAFIKNYLEAEKARREEEGEKGFSLIELIIVVVILGILVAIAIPIFAGLQDTAQKNALSTVAANGATAVAAQIANGLTGASLTSAIGNELDQLEDGDIVLTNVSTGTTVEGVCVAATKAGASTPANPGGTVPAPTTSLAYAGPGC
jgi:prepilin-type N-terminal cleavage/methylation domain-containing protein